MATIGLLLNSQNIHPQPAIKKKRGGYRPGSGRKRIHPKKEDVDSKQQFKSLTESFLNFNSLHVNSAPINQNQDEQINRVNMNEISDFEVQLLLGLEFDFKTNKREPEGKFIYTNQSVYMDSQYSRT